MNKETQLKGGCLCGEIRYQTTALPFAAEYCHCSMCQKIAGSAVSTWMDFKTEQLTWTKGKPQQYQSSEFIQRGFCKNCGSTISFRDSRHPDYFTIAITSLDNPNLVKPTYHIYTQDQVEWLKIDDNCKRFKQAQI